MNLGPNHPLFITAAGMGLEIQCSDSDLMGSLSRHYKPFSGQSEDNFCVRIEVIGRSGSLMDISRLISFEDQRILFSGPDINGWIAEDLRRASLSFSSQFAFEIADYFLRVVLAIMAFNAGGLMLHAAGIVHRGRTYLFLGHSGSGKTTVARLSNLDIVLNDDLVVALPAQGTWEVHATPFWNPTQVQPVPGFGRIAGLYHLVQDKQVFVEKIQPAQTIAELITNIPVLLADPARNQDILSRARVLAQEIPCFRLHFLPDASFWKVIEDGEITPTNGY